MKIRAARAAAAYFRSQDKDTMITENMIRQLMQRGVIPTIRNGNRVMTSIEAIERYLENALDEEGNR